MGWGIDHLCVETQRAILSYPVAQQELRPPVETQEFKVDRAVVQRRTSNCGCATALEQCTNCTYFTKIIVGTAQEQWHTTTGCLPPPANRGVMVRHPTAQRELRPPRGTARKFKMDKTVDPYPVVERCSLYTRSR